MNINTEQFEEMSATAQNMTLFLMIQEISARLEALEQKEVDNGVSMDGAPQFVKDFVQAQKKGVMNNG